MVDLNKAVVRKGEKKRNLKEFEIYLLEIAVF